MRSDATGVGLALMVLTLGFAFSATAIGQYTGDAVAVALAWAAGPLLGLFEADLVRIGTELRSPEGWAIRVSEVCDGLGLIIALAAGLAVLATDLRRGVLSLLAGVAAIQLFNLFRIVALAITLDHAPASFDVVHTSIFPYLTAALLAACLLPARVALQLIVVAVPFGLALTLFQTQIAAGFALAANIVLAAVAGPEVGQIAERAAGWTIGTGLLASPPGEDVRRFLAPLSPSDFLLGLPLLLAAITLSRKAVWLVPVAVSLLAAIVVAGVATVWTLANQQAQATLIVPQGDGWRSTLFVTPETGLQILRLVQSTLVHFNLLVLPFLIVGSRRRYD